MKKVDICEYDDALNLRRLDDGVMETVGRHKPVATIKSGDRLAGSDKRGDRCYFFVERNGELWQSGYDEHGTFVEEESRLFFLDGELLGIASTGDFVVVSTSSGLRYLHYSSRVYKYLGSAPKFPVLAFGIADRTELSEVIPAYQAKSTYQQWSGTLLSDDLLQMEKAISSAVKKLKRKAISGLRALNPLMVRTALRLWDDSLVWSPMAAVVGNFQEPSVVARVSNLSAGAFRIEESELKISAWKIAMRVVDAGMGNWSALVKAVEVYASEEQDTVGNDAAFRCEVSQQGAPSYSLRMTLDNTAVMTACRELPLHNKFRRIAAFTDIEQLAGSMVLDVTGGKADAGYVPPIASFRSDVLSTVGNRCFAGNVTKELPEPPRYESLCDADGLRSGLVSAKVAVELSLPSGRSLVVGSSLCEVWSLSLGGFVAYPDCRAVKITVAITANGKNYSWSSGLNPSMEGNYAYAFSPDGFILSEVASIPDFVSGNVVEHLPEMLLVSDSDNPLQWRECGKAQNRGVVAVAASFGYGSSLSLGRHSVYLFATDGTYLLSFDLKGDCTGGSLVSRRTVGNAGNVAAGDACVVFVDSGGVVCRTSGSKVVATGVVIDNPDGVGYSLRYGEILVGNDGGGIIVVDGSDFTSRRHGSLERVSDGCFLLDGDSACTFEMEEGGSVEVGLQTKAIRIASGYAVDAVEWNLSSHDADLSLSVYGGNGVDGCCLSLLSRLEVKGRVCAPLLHRLPASRMRTIKLSVTGTLSATDRVYPAKLLLRKL